MKKIYYYCLLLIWYVLISFIALTYWRRYGWGFIVVAFLILYVGDNLITKFFKPGLKH
ncbi:hypothetical protein [Clostridium sp.]|uniref:hypothetical protein n=1 Tax=Clostridium sp. TaxID=1506 RepID=UPI0026397BC0|nr:hypothetical protein [uncultured Clostridium sp.]